MRKAIEQVRHRRQRRFRPQNTKTAQTQPLYIRVEYLIQLGQASGKTVPIPRSLRESPNYSPCWRSEVFEQHLIKIAEAKDESTALSELLSKERDAFVRQVLLFHFGRRCVIADAVQYAVQCRQSQAQTRIAGMIKAMVVAGRTAEQIALEVGTDPRSISAFEKLCFDVRRFLENRAWLKEVCYPALLGNEPAYRQAEARWLAVAFERGWAGLAPCFLRPLHIKPRTGREELNRFWQVLLSRAVDFVGSLERKGAPPTERDLVLFQAAQQQAKKLGFPSTSLSDLDYVKPPEAEEENALHEAQEVVKGLSLEGRKKIARILESVKYQAEQNAHTKEPTAD